MSTNVDECPAGTRSRTHPMWLPSPQTGTDRWTLLLSPNNEAPGALWNNRLAWTIWSCLLACKLPELQSLIVIPGHPVHFEHVGWVCIFLMLAMATEDVRNMQKFHELGFRWFFRCVGTLCLAFGLNFVLWIWPSYAWGKTPISASFLSMWTYCELSCTHIYIYTYIYVITNSFCIGSSRIWDV